MQGRRHTHVEDQRAGKAGQGGKVERRIGLFGVLVPGHQRHGRSFVAMRDGDTRIAGRCQSGRHAGHNLELDSLRPQVAEFLARPAKDHRIAVLEPNDGLVARGKRGQQLVDFGLRLHSPAAVFAEGDEHCGRPAVAENRRIGEVVVQDDVGPLEDLDRAQRDEARIARPRAYQIDFAFRHSL